MTTQNIIQELQDEVNNKFSSLQDKELYDFLKDYVQDIDEWWSAEKPVNLLAMLRDRGYYLEVKSGHFDNWKETPQAEETFSRSYELKLYKLVEKKSLNISVKLQLE